MSDYTHIGHFATAAGYRRDAKRAYYRARKHERDADRFDRYADSHDGYAAWWESRIGTVNDDGDAAEQARLHRADSAGLRRLAASTRALAPEERRRARLYNKMARRYEARAEGRTS